MVTMAFPARWVRALDTYKSTACSAAAFVALGMEEVWTKERPAPGTGTVQAKGCRLRAHKCHCRRGPVGSVCRARMRVGPVQSGVGDTPQEAEAEGSGSDDSNASNGDERLRRRGTSKTEFNSRSSFLLRSEMWWGHPLDQCRHTLEEGVWQSAGLQAVGLTKASKPGADGTNDSRPFWV